MKSLATIALLVLLLGSSLLFCITSFGFAQVSKAPLTQWSMTYNALSGNSVVQTDDSGFLVLGSAAVYSDNQANALLKIDASGNQVWLKNVDSFGQNMYLAKATSGDFAIATTTFQSVPYSDYGTPSTYHRNEFYLSKFDSDGNELWAQTYGGGLRSIRLSSFASTADGGFVLGGYGNYYDPSSFTGSSDKIVILRTDPDGNLLWNRTYGGSDNNNLFSISQTSDGGFVMLAYSLSFKENQSIWLVKIDDTGAIQWSSFYKSSDLNLQPSSTFANGGFQTQDKGYLVFGGASYYQQNGGYESIGLAFKTDLNGNVQWVQYYPVWIDYAIQTQDNGYALSYAGSGGTTVLTRTDNLGRFQWNATYPAATETFGNPLIQARDKGLVLTGKSSNALWILKTAPLQTVQSVELPKPKPLASGNASQIWQHFFDGLDVNSVISTSDGGFACVGETATVQNSVLDTQYVNYSSVLIRTDSLGNLVFRKDLPIGGTIYQDTSSTINSVDVIMAFVAQTADGGFVFAGTTTLHRNSGNYANYCMAKTDPEGNVLWIQQYDFRDGLSGFVQAKDGGFVLAGSAGSVPSRVTHIVKTDAAGNVQWSQNLSLNSLAQVIATDDGGYTLLGSTYVSVSGSSSGSSSIIHLSSNGIVAWANPLSGFAPKTGIQTSDGGYIVVGQSDPYHYLSPTIFLKLDNFGSISWYKLYDNQPIYCPRSLITCEEGGYLFAATTPDYRCLVKVDQNGTIRTVFTLNTLWTRYYDSSISVIQSSDGNYVFAGKYIELNTTEYDAIWLSKVSPTSSGFPTPSTSASVPEFSTWTALLIFGVAALSTTLLIRRKIVRAIPQPKEATQ